MRKHVTHILCAVFMLFSVSAFAAGPLDWSNPTPPTSPVGRTAHSMAYDKLHRQVVVFGGQPDPDHVLSDTWVWDGATQTWTLKSQSGPAGTLFSTMAYDEARQVTVLYSASVDETWTWDGSVWTKKNPAHSPGARFFTSMAYDATRQQVVLFGGSNQSFQTKNDTWTWDGSDWAQKTPSTTPPARFIHMMSWDGARQQVLLYGGAGLDDTWAWNGSNWTQKTPATKPPRMMSAVMVYDEARQQVVLALGDDSGGGGPATGTSATWTWDGSTWTKQTPVTTPTPVWGTAGAYDSDSKQTVAFGGVYRGQSMAETWLYGEPPTTSNITITSAASGFTFSTSGTGCAPAANYASGTTLQWTIGASCQVSAPATLSPSTGTQYVFTGWADGNTSNPRTITAPATASTYTANYKTQYQLTTSANPTAGGSVTASGFYDAGATANVVATPVTTYSFSGWTPTLTPNTASSSLTISAPTTLTANFVIATSTTVAAATGQYSDAVTLKATMSTGTYGGSLQFKVNGVNAGAAIAVSGGGDYTQNYTIGLAAGSYTISAAFTPTLSTVTSSSGSSTLTVAKEDATLAPSSTNPQAVQVNAPGGSAGPISLAATLTQAADGSLGDLTKAQVSTTLVALVGGGTITCPTTVSSTGAVTASCAVVPVNVYTVQWKIGGTYFSGAQASSALSVYDPSLGFVTGGGSVNNNGVRGEFAFNVKYLKSGALQGGLTYVEHRATGDVTVQSTALSSLSIIGKTAVLVSKATVNGAGGYVLQATMTDNGQPGIGRDLFGITVGTIYLPAITISGGNIQVPQGK